MKFVLDGYCGLYCGACPVRLGTQAGTEPNPCYGCKSEQPAGHCATCGIKACARRKGYAFCDECAELKTCEQLQQFLVDPQWPYHQGVLKNMEVIRREGVAQWLEAQQARWRCTHCGTPHSWWDEGCPRCGQAVASYKADL
ncbi:hypothetical protein TFLX_05267 [Thermoflexales bacterium]|nr:hypothetical protein TFLX_05267 [Thermoflexales bacterium]